MSRVKITGVIKTSGKNRPPGATVSNLPCRKEPAQRKVTQLYPAIHVLRGVILSKEHDEQSFYVAPAKKARCRFTVQGSKFIGTLLPAADEEDVREAILSLQAEFPDATHHAYAYRISTGINLVERASDDGEPSGSAGPPILQVLQGRNISDAVVIGTRFFGGTKLGIGGLTRAYRDCARLSLEKALLKKKEQLNEYELHLDYEVLGAVNRLLESMEGKIAAAEYTEAVKLKVIVPARLANNFIESFDAVCRGQGRWSNQQR